MKIKSILIASLLFASLHPAEAMGPKARISSMPDGGKAFRPAPAPWVKSLSSCWTFNSSRIAKLGLQSLTYLSTKGLDTNTNLENDPGAALRLTRQIEAMGYDHESFAALGLDQRIEVLRQAAEKAEKDATAEAEEMFRRSKEKANLLQLESSANSLWQNDLPYLSYPNRSKVSELLGKIWKARANHNEKVATFLRETPQKIHTGVFDRQEDWLGGGSRQHPVYSKVDGKWLAADHSAFPEFDSLEQAFAQRIKEIDRVPAGPWSEKIIRNMEQALKQEQIQKELDKEGGAGAAIKLHDMVLHAKWWQEVRLSPAGVTQSSGLDGALSAMAKYERTGRVPSPVHVKQISEYYDGLFKPHHDLPMSWRIASWMAWGEPHKGYPSWKTLQTLKQKSIQKTTKMVIYSSVALMAATTAPAFTSVQGWVLISLLASFAAAATAYALSIWRRNMLDAPEMGAETGWNMNNFLKDFDKPLPPRKLPPGIHIVM